MAWADLKAAVAAVIRTNGNQEITGALLQSTLNSIIDQVGANASYKGVAIPSTNPGTPDAPIFYLASVVGTYSNFGGYVHDGGVSILSNSTGSWSGVKLLSVKQTTGTSTTDPMSQKTVTDELKYISEKTPQYTNDSTLNSYIKFIAIDLSGYNGVPTLTAPYTIAIWNGSSGLYGFQFAGVGTPGLIEKLNYSSSTDTFDLVDKGCKFRIVIDKNKFPAGSVISGKTLNKSALVWDSRIELMQSQISTNTANIGTNATDINNLETGLVDANIKISNLSGDVYGIKGTTSTNRIANVQTGVPNFDFLKVKTASSLTYGTTIDQDSLSPFKDLIGKTISLIPYAGGRNYSYNPTFDSTRHPSKIVFSYWVNKINIGTNDKICWGIISSSYNYNSLFTDLKSILDEGVGSIRNLTSEVLAQFTLVKKIECVYNIGDWYQIIETCTMTWTVPTIGWVYGIRLGTSNENPIQLVNPQIIEDDIAPVGVFVIKDIINSINPYPQNTIAFIQDDLEEVHESITDINNRIDGISGERLMTLKFEGGRNLLVRCKDWNTTEDFIWKLDTIGGNNSTPNLLYCGTILKSVLDSNLTYGMSSTKYGDTPDDTAPVSFNGSYFGANHAATIVHQIVVASHSLTIQDIGSVWKDSNNVRALLIKIVSPTVLWFLNLDDSRITSGNGPFNGAENVFISPMVHDSGATHTGDIPFTSDTKQTQMWPAVNHVSNKVYIDDKEVTENGLYFGDSVKSICSYDIIYIPTILTYLQNNVGNNDNNSYHSDAINDKYLTINIVQEFRPNGSQTTYIGYKLDTRSSLNFAYIYGVQSGFGFYDIATENSYKYVPGNNSDNLVLQSNSSTLTFDQWNDLNIVPYRYFTFNNSKSKGFQLAFSRDTHYGNNNIRKSMLLANSSGWSPTTRKIYPIFTAGTHPAGEYFEMIAGRIPLNQNLIIGSDLTAVSWYWENNAIILTIDSHIQCDEKIILPDYLCNKKVEILDKTDSVISYPTVTVGREFYYTTNSAIGHLVIKLT